jgi:hypothetical protein
MEKIKRALFEGMGRVTVPLTEFVWCVLLMATTFHFLNALS